MYVLTTDQVASRTGPDAVDDVIALLRGTVKATRAPVRTVGDEVQLVVSRAADALAVVLALARTGGWSTGLGIGAVERPMPRTVRAARGPAFIAAREAVEAAKKRPTRFAVRVPGAPANTGTDLQALVDLLLTLRARRSPEGWEVHDLLAQGLTQREVAARLGISAQAVNDRVRVAELALDDAARPALVRLLAAADALADPATDPATDPTSENAAGRPARQGTPA